MSALDRHFDSQLGRFLADQEPENLWEQCEMCGVWYNDKEACPECGWVNGKGMPEE